MQLHGCPGSEITAFPRSPQAFSLESYQCKRMRCNSRMMSLALPPRAKMNAARRVTKLSSCMWEKKSSFAVLPLAQIYGGIMPSKRLRRIFLMSRQPRERTETSRERHIGCTLRLQLMGSYYVSLVYRGVKCDCCGIVGVEKPGPTEGTYLPARKKHTCAGVTAVFRSPCRTYGTPVSASTIMRCRAK